MSEEKLYKPVPEFPHLVETPAGRIERRVVCAANRLEDGLIICGARHWDQVMRSVADRIGWDDCKPSEQGFIDQWGNFMDRKEARMVAIENKQPLTDRLHSRDLFSENLY